MLLLGVSFVQAQGGSSTVPRWLLKGRRGFFPAAELMQLGGLAIRRQAGKEGHQDAVGMWGNGSRAWSKLGHTGDPQASPPEREEGPGLSCPRGHHGDVTARPCTGLVSPLWMPTLSLGSGEAPRALQADSELEGREPTQGGAEHRGSGFAPAHAGVGAPTLPGASSPQHPQLSEGSLPYLEAPGESTGCV